MKEEQELRVLKRPRPIVAAVDAAISLDLSRDPAVVPLEPEMPRSSASALPSSSSAPSRSTPLSITAGVGGPLIDTRGNLLGMNFYHHEETPFLWHMDPTCVEADTVDWDGNPCPQKRTRHMDPTCVETAHFCISLKEADTIECGGNPPTQEKINRSPLPKPKPLFFRWPKHKVNRPTHIMKSRFNKANATEV